MKLNLNNYVMSSSEFCELIAQRLGIKTCDTEILSKQHPQVTTHMLPYYYMWEHITSNDWKAFKIFYGKLLNMSNIDCPDINSIFVTSDITLVYTFIVAAQYYFL
jgi:hypothetical protein